MTIKSFLGDLWLGFAIIGAAIGALFPLIAMVYIIWSILD